MINSRWITGNRCNDARSIYLADQVIVLIFDVQIALRIERESFRLVETCHRSRAIVAAITLSPIARNAGQYVRASIYPEDLLGGFSREIDVARRIDNHVGGTIERCTGCRTPNAAQTAGTGTGDHGDVATRVDFADSVAIERRDIHVPCEIDCPRRWIAQWPKQCRPAVGFAIWRVDLTRDC